MSVGEASKGYLASLQGQETAMVALLERLVNMDTPTGSKPQLDRAMDVVAEEAAARGASTERVQTDTAGNHLVARWSAGGAAKHRVLVLAHLDTVWPDGEVARRPFADEGDGRLTGPGIFDMKAGVVQALFAIDQVRNSAALSGSEIVLVVSTDEESGSATSRTLMEDLAKISTAVLVVEPATDTKLKTARKGVGMFRVVAHGVASHAGLEPEKGRSAILELSHQIIRLHELNNPATGTSVTVGTSSGGSGRNVVPARAEATVDVRVVTSAEAEKVEAAIRSLKPVLEGTSLEITGGINRPPMERTAATAALYARAEVVAGALGEPLGEILVGGGSDGNFTSALGIPTLDGLGAVGGGAHALNEHVQREKLPVRSALLAGVIHDLLENGV